MKKLKGILLGIFGFLGLHASVFASSSRIIDVDSFRSSNHSTTWSLPSTSDTLSGIAASQTLTNKVINGSNNTLTNVPISASMVQETPSGSINGSNTTFTLANIPGSNSSVQVYLDGIVLIQSTDYTLSSATITMTTAPALAQKLYVVYAKL